MREIIVDMSVNYGEIYFKVAGVSFIKVGEQSENLSVGSTLTGWEISVRALSKYISFIVLLELFQRFLIKNTVCDVWSFESFSQGGAQK